MSPFKFKSFRNLSFCNACSSNFLTVAYFIVLLFSTMTSAIVHLSVVNDSSQELVFQEQVESVVCAVALDNTTVEAATKDALLVFYNHCGRFVLEKRYGQMFSGELERRVSVLLPHFCVTARIDDRRQLEPREMRWKQD